MNHPLSAVYRRSALALSSVAVTTAVCLGGLAPAAADPYDDGDSSEVAPDDSGSFDEPADEPAEQDPNGSGADDPEPDAPGPGADAPGPPAEEPAPADEEPAGPDGGEDPFAEDPAVPGAEEAPGGEDPGAGAAPGDPGDPVGGEEGAGADSAEADFPDLDIAEVPQSDFDQAQRADVVEIADPAPASQTEVTELTESLESVVSTSTWTSTSTTWSSQVTQWNSSWIGYDTYYRPVFTNPYNTPLQLIYFYDGATRVFDVPPLQRAALTAPSPGVYPFTAVSRDASGQPRTVSTGSFSGGGYRPAPGQPPPAKPQAPAVLRNVLVQVKYSDGTSKPFRVKTLADLGDDASVGARRVLLDDETTAWGTWGKAGNGERLFEVTSTQQLPGLTKPSQGPLPGYRVQLASSQAAPASQEKKWVKPLVIAAAVSGVLAVGAVLFFVLSGRRRKGMQ